MLQISDLLGIQAHHNNKDNPHDVNKQDVDLGNVNNFATATQRSQYENETGSLYASAAGVGDYVKSKVNPIAEAINGLSIPTFANDATALAGTSTSTIINPARLKYVLGQKIPSFASNAQIDSGSSTNVIVSPAGMKRYVQNNLPDAVDVPDFATEYTAKHNTTNLTTMMSPLRTHQLIDQKMPKASQAQAEAGTYNHGYMTPQRVGQAIKALGASKFRLKEVDNGRYGVFWDPATGFGLQWGQTLAMGPNSGTINYYITDFEGMPFNVWGSSHTYANDSGEWNDLCEVGAFIISRSINNDSFKVATRRLDGKNVDGVVFAWCAIGIVDPLNNGFRQTNEGQNRSSSISHNNAGLIYAPINSSGHLVGK